MNREDQAAEALSIFGVLRFVDFVRRIREDSHCLAVGFINAELDEGQSLQEIFFTGEDLGYTLRITEVNPSRYSIEFGCLVDPRAGDGGTWDVILDRAGDFVRIADRGSWIA